MASIGIDKNRAWVAARWAVRYVLERVNLDDVTPVVARRIAYNLDRNLIYLELEDLSPADREQFGRQVARIADSLEQAGPDSLATPSIHGDLVEGLREFQHLVEASVAEESRITG